MQKFAYVYVPHIDPSGHLPIAPLYVFLYYSNCTAEDVLIKPIYICYLYICKGFQ